MTAIWADTSLGSPTMRRLLAIFVASVSLISGLAMNIVTAGPARAYPSDHVSITGHGFGHGRGMGQFGALGYALKGSSAGDILGHFYSNTAPGSIPNANIRVQLVANDAQDMLVEQEKGHLNTSVGALSPGNTAVRVRVKDLNAGLLTVEQAPSCGGPWQPMADNIAGEVRVTPTAPSSDHSDLLQVCRPGSNRWYEGDLIGLIGTGQERTVNDIPIETYVKGVVPRESPASWGPLGGGACQEALKAQAVAARSYAQA